MREPIFRSNGGKGPLLARIIGDDGETVTMVRWNEKGKAKQKRETVFTLPRRFLYSPNCGWRQLR